jgi:hypothetical protein
LPNIARLACAEDFGFALEDVEGAAGLWFVFSSTIHDSTGEFARTVLTVLRNTSKINKSFAALQLFCNSTSCKYVYISML